MYSIDEIVDAHCIRATVQMEKKEKEVRETFVVVVVNI
jgi:hypothetical protein